MLNISGISKNSASFGNREPRIIVLNPQNQQPKNSELHNNSEFGDVVDISDADVVNDFTMRNASDPIDEKAKYDEQKDFLNNAKRNVEETISNVEDMVGNSKVGKPIKTAGKIILGAISVAMGFVSMKWATIGTMKVGENIVKSPVAQKIAKEMAKPFTAGYNLVADAVKKGKVGEKISKTVSGAASALTEKLKGTKAGQTLNDLTDNAKNSNIFKRVAELADNAFEKVNNVVSTIKEKGSKITGEKVKATIANFFGVSGGVTAGVETIQAEHNRA